MNRFNAGDLAFERSSLGSVQPDTVAEIIQHARPDVLLINEFDYDAGGIAAAGFQTNYLSIPHGDAQPIVYPYRYGLPQGALFVIAGDQNSDPLDGDSIPGAVQQPLDHPLVNTTLIPNSAGAPEQAFLQGGLDNDHLSDPAFDTADFFDGAPGNLRA